MAIIAPFRGLRYNSEKIGKMEDVVTPPYDVIDMAGQKTLHEKNPYNMINLDLSKNFSQEMLTEQRYQGARNLFEKWQNDDILVRDEKPCLYIYNIQYNHPSGQQLVRKGLVALVRLSEFSEGIVKPHEKTFREVTTDRLRLLDTCQAQFSQIFSLFSDSEGEIMNTLEQAADTQPLYNVKDGHGNLHSLYQVKDPEAIALSQKMFADKSIYIADGHHRYTTALQMRELMQERMGSMPDTSPFNHTMMYLCCMEDPGLSVLPTHRLLYWPGKITTQEFIDRITPGFIVQEVSGGSREFLIGEALNGMEETGLGTTSLAVYHPVEDRCLLLNLKEGMMHKVFESKIPAALLELDVVVLSELLLGHYLDLNHERCEKEKLIDYFSDPDEALDVSVKDAAANENKTPLLFLMNHTPVAQVKRIADEKLVMPHKSTYFYPKILTGLLINKLLADEQIA